MADLMAFARSLGRERVRDGMSPRNDPGAVTKVVEHADTQWS